MKFRLAAALRAGAALEFHMDLHVFARGGGEFIVLLVERAHAARTRRPRHFGGGRRRVDAKGARRVRRVVDDAREDHLALAVARRLLNGRREIDQPRRALALRLAVGADNVDAINENHPDVGVLGRARARHVGDPAGGQHFLKRGVVHVEIKLEPVLGGLFEHGLRPRLS